MYIIHLGFPKTGTTWLQNRYFPKLDVNFIGKAIYLSLDKDKIEFMDQFHQLINSNHISNSLTNIIKKTSIYVKNENKHNLISSEAILGNIWWGMRDMHNNISIIKEIFQEDVKIFVTIRSQIKMIESLYKQYILEGGRLSFSKFLNLNNQLFINFDLNSLKYARYYKFLVNIFGRENVLFLPFELIQNNLNEFNLKFHQFTKLENKLDTDKDIDQSYIRTGFSINECYYRRYFNKILMSSMNPENLFLSSYAIKNKKNSKILRALGPDGICYAISKIDNYFIKRKLFNDDEINFLNKKYTLNNNQLSKKIGIDLKALDYP